ncbi:AAA family ATPase [Dethiosulfatarculus sandiegensis]|uniref:ATPase AAA-type core domain-containing protein n=1 Tax=Dethiosulfatarculus sandiegensis TaxID=1429043 RepID=A0A0D2JT23_9BACT|nr:ATP-binding protein [Dethiosulfatarculus sandiegensis]KIX12620.1 hypothetical protein X474_18620 [Dethiosulfatarculus sandiegensis]
MLLYFSVENFRSFKDEATLTMEASSDNSMPQNMFHPDSEAKYCLLKSAALYGANASGKSNFIKAVSFMRDVVLSSADLRPDDSGPQYSPFKLDASFGQRPSYFEIGFFCNSVRYTYSFSILGDVVYSEKLVSYPHTRPRLLFERQFDQAKGESKFSFGASWKGEKQRLAKNIRKKSLFLSVAASLNHELALELFDWFYEKLRLLHPLPYVRSEILYTLEVAYKDPDLKSRILAMLKWADFSISDLEIEKQALEKADFLKKLPEPVKAYAFDSIPKDKDPYSLYARAGHAGLDKKGSAHQVYLHMDDEESDGTRKFFAMTGPVINVLQNGGCLLADEMDVRLHPHLSRALIGLFHDEKVNKKGAQLIFASHDANLLDVKGLLRRDQVWLVDRGKDGASSLTCLWDFSPRKGENLRKSYLAGFFGGVPYVEDPLEFDLDG